MTPEFSREIALIINAPIIVQMDMDDRISFIERIEKVSNIEELNKNDQDIIAIAKIQIKNPIFNFEKVRLF